MKSRLLLIISALAFTALATQAQVIIPITNASFENPQSLASGVYQYGIPSWDTSSNGISGEQTGSSAGYSSGYDGQNFAFNDSPAQDFQTLSSTYQVGTYSLTFAMGSRPNTTTAGGSFGLNDQSGNLVASSGLLDSQIAGTGTFTDHTITYVVTPGSALIGQDIQVYFQGVILKNNPGYGNDDFDNARLTFTAAATPEPSTYALMLGTLALGFGLMRLRGLSRS